MNFQPPEEDDPRDDDQRMQDDKKADLAHTGQAAPAGEVASSLPLGSKERMMAEAWTAGMREKIADSKDHDRRYTEGWNDGFDAAKLRQTLATPSTEPAAPGYVSVPVEPTEAMLMAGARSIIDGNEKRMGTSWGEEAENAYRAMLAAASTVQGKEKP